MESPYLESALQRRLSSFSRPPLSSMNTRNKGLRFHQKLLREPRSPRHSQIT